MLDDPDPLRYVVRDVTPPNPPDSLQASEAGNGQVLLTWTPGMDADLAGYTLYRGTSVNDTLMQALNERHLAASGPDAMLEARIASSAAGSALGQPG